MCIRDRSYISIAFFILFLGMVALFFYSSTAVYGNGWLALTLQSVEDEAEDIVLSVNLESMDALDLPRSGSTAPTIG